MITCIDTADTRVALYSEDPAIDKAATGEEGLKRYLDTLDESALVLKAGQTPTRFHLRPLDSAEDRRVMSRALRDPDAKGAAEAAGVGMVHEAFQAGCPLVENLFELGDRVEVTDEVIIKIPGAVVREIGMHIVNMSSPTDSGKSPVGEDEGK